MLIGVDDKTGAAVGKRFGDDVLNSLGGLRSDGNIQSLPAMMVSRIGLSDGSGDVVVIEVHPSDMPPVRYKGQVWIRVGPRRAVASEQEERMLTERRVARARTFDMRPCLDAVFEDLALELFHTYRARAIAPEVIEENHRAPKQQMASLRIFDLRHDCPTNAGILLLGKDPRFWIPGPMCSSSVSAGPTSRRISRRKRRYRETCSPRCASSTCSSTCRSRAARSPRPRCASRRSRITLEQRCASS